MGIVADEDAEVVAIQGQRQPVAGARQKILIQVKSGGVKRGDVATLLGDVGNQKAVGGILITLDPPTPAMKKEAVEAGRYACAL